MTLPSKHKWISLTILAILIPTSLLTAFKLTGIIPEPPTIAETIEKEAVTLNFTFTWGPDSQKIVQGTFCLEISLRYSGGGMCPANESLIMVIKANDDDYEEWDYIGLVFDTNGNGHIDIDDISIALFANNLTQPSVLWEDGFLIFAQTVPKHGPQNVRFDPEKGYTFTVQLPCMEYPLNLPQFLKKGCDNLLHICFYDDDAGKVFVRFVFHIPEEG